MKKFIFFIILFISIDVSAQRQSQGSYKFGVKGGMSSVNMTGTRVKSPWKIALVGGIWCQIRMSKNWTAQAEAIYIEKGTGGFDKNHSAVVGPYGSYRVAIMYLEVPILFQYHKKNVNFEFGPGLGALTYQYEYLPGAPTPNMTSDYPFTSKEFSFNLGLGYNLNEKWYIGLRYTNSLLPVRKQIPNISKQVYNRVFSITISRQIKFKKSKTKDEEVGE